MVALGQRTTKLQAVKVGYLARIEPNLGGLGLSPAELDDPQSLTDHNFAAFDQQRLTVPPLKDLNHNIICDQEIVNILKIVYTLLK